MEIEVLGLPMMTNMGLSWSSGPSLLMEGLMPLMPITLMAHTHIESTHLAASMLSNCQASHFRNLFIYLSIFIFQIFIISISTYRHVYWEVVSFDDHTLLMIKSILFQYPNTLLSIWSSK